MFTRSDVSDAPALGSSRRDFIRFLIGVSFISTFAGVSLPLISYLLPPDLPTRTGVHKQGPSLVGSLADFAPGTGKIVLVDNKPVIIVNTVEGGVRAFSAVCTHLGCVVEWNESRNVIQSPCHNGRFNPVTGAVVSGPPPRALPAFELAIKGGNVYVGNPLGPIYGL